MTIPPDLKGYHQVLGDRFRQLADSRPGLPVFAIEHGLEPEELAVMRRHLARQLELDPDIGSFGWSLCYLPLVVIASEVGYRYRGTGTDFWPLLAQELNLESRSIPPAQLSRLFELSHRTFGLVRPGNSPWEQHFPHIAWPISNAAVPVEVQGPLAKALRAAVRAGVSADSAEGLVHHVRGLASGLSGTRFENWLRNADLSGEVMIRLLNPVKDGWLSNGLVRRIDADLRTDAESRRAIGEARRVNSRRSGRQTSIPPSRFTISIDGNAIGRISARGPTLSADLREQVISALQIRGDLLGSTETSETIQLHLFLAGGQLDLGPADRLPAAPLRRADSAGSASTQALQLLEGLQPQMTEFFRLEPGNGSAIAVLPGDHVGNDATILRVQTEDQGLAITRRLDASSSSDADVLRRYGISVRSGHPPFRLKGLPMPGSGAEFAAGFPVLALAAPGDRQLLLDKEETAHHHVEIGGSCWAVFDPKPGSHSIGPDGLEEEGQVHFSLIEPPDVEAASISISPVGATLEDLMDGALEIRIRAPLPIENVAVRVGLIMPGEEDIFAEGVIDRLPVHVGGRMPLLDNLRSSLAARGAVPGQGSAARLRVMVQGLFAENFALVPFPQLFQYDEGGNFWTDGQGKKLGSTSRRATLSSLLPSTATTPDGAGITLILPDSDGWGALGAGHIRHDGAPLRAREGAGMQLRLPPPTREARSRDGRPGLIEMAGGYLAWKLARASDPIAGWFQQRAIERLEAGLVALLCGDNWCKIEEGLDLSIISPAGALRLSAQRLGLLSGEDLPLVSDSRDADFLRQRITTRLRVAVPDHEAALADWDEELAGELDLAVIEAYEDLRRRILEQGREAFDEVDMQRPGSRWLLALQMARDIPRLTMFRRFVLPDSRWDALSVFPYEAATEDDIVELLDSCHVDASRRPGLRWIGRPELRAMLQLWTSPRLFSEAADWQQCLARSLSDTQTARAVRYAALRRKLSRLEFPGEGLV